MGFAQAAAPRTRSPRSTTWPASPVTTTGCWRPTSPRAWMHRHTAPFADCRVQNSPSWGVGTSIRRPFLRPVRVMTARSSPRLTRCNTVWRETPSARVAYCMATQPSGASSTSMPRSSSVRRIRQGAGGELLASDEAVVEPAEQGGGGDPELPGGFGHVEQLSFRNLVAGLVAGDGPVVSQRLDSTGGV